MEIIQINWEGPFKIDKILEDKNNSFFDKKGLYQIYGLHPLYGNDVLLYIGRTKDKKGFRSRLKNRYEIIFNSDSKNTNIYLGEIISENKLLTDEEIENKIEKAEVLMINTLKPAYNSSNVKSVKNSYMEDEYMIENYNNFKNLYPIFTSKYMWHEYKNYVILEKLAKELQKEVDYNEPIGFWIDDEEVIWIGIDENIWYDYKFPIQIAIKKNNIDLKFLQKSFKNKIIEYYPDDEEYYYINAIDELDENNVDTIKDSLNFIIKNLK